jgi:hypothetical protein
MFNKPWRFRLPRGPKKPLPKTFVSRFRSTLRLRETDLTDSHQNSQPDFEFFFFFNPATGCLAAAVSGVMYMPAPRRCQRGFLIKIIMLILLNKDRKLRRRSRIKGRESGAAAPTNTGIGSLVHESALEFCGARPKIMCRKKKHHVI